MKNLALSAAFAAVCLLAPLSATAQDKTLPGLNQQQTDFLLCLTVCQKTFNHCVKQNTLPAEVIQLDEDRIRRMPPPEVFALFRCHDAKSNCDADCLETHGG